ncbi:protein kinase regulatory subunit [Martiniozyma asiatica (nom. inval.)]|nr:protein kinase regulatory subunit [Martiniozyma asiatica]
MSFESLFNSAHNVLQIARSICSDTDNEIENCLQLLEKRESDKVLSDYGVVAIHQLLDLFDLVRQRISKEISDKLKQRDLFLKKINKELNKLQEIKIKMLQITVDFEIAIENKNFKPNTDVYNKSFESENMENSQDKNKKVHNKKKTLYDFIDDESMSILLKDIGALNDKLCKTPDKKFIDSILLRFDNQATYLTKQWENIQSGYKSHFNDGSDSLLTLLMKNNDAIEYDMVELLKGLNSHLDKCLIYQKEPTKELFNVIKDDDSKLASVLETLKKNANIVHQNCKDIQRIIAVMENHKIKSISFLNELNEFNENVVEKQIQGELSNEWEKMNEMVVVLYSMEEEVIGFQIDCQSFMESYNKLLLELERRRKTNLKIQKMITDFQTELETFKQEDIKKRGEFWHENAEFIPQDLIDGDFITSSFPKVVINYQLENIPKVSQASLSEAMNQLNL